MSSALDASVGIVGYLALFAGVGFAFVFVNLLVGRFLRPRNPHPEKLEIYECGEPAIGSSFVQFDLRFYVVALVFIIFDVEVAFLFPWATVFGKVSALRNESAPIVTAGDGGALQLTPTAAAVYREMGDETALAGGVARSERELRHGRMAASDGAAREPLALAGLDQIVTFIVLEVAVFFVILLVGFAYEWRLGALDWIRAMTSETQRRSLEQGVAPRGSPQESVLSA